MICPAPDKQDSKGHATPCNNPVAWVGAGSPRVMAFTATSGRPEMALLCAMQLHHQWHKQCDHYMWINGDPDYSGLIKRYAPWVNVKHGPVAHQHINHISAIKMADLDRYDLFLKIDDDDFYAPPYLNNTVESFIKDGWHFSGGSSNGVLIDGVFREDVSIQSLGASRRDQELGVTMAMPSTYAFSRSAIDVILNINHVANVWEDPQWRWALKEAGMDCFIRKTPGFSYNKHSSNTSKPTVGPRRVRFSAQSFR